MKFSSVHVTKVAPKLTLCNCLQ